MSLNNVESNILLVMLQFKVITKIHDDWNFSAPSSNRSQSPAALQHY